MKSVLLFVCLTVAIPSVIHAQNLLINGGFEEPIVDAGTFIAPTFGNEEVSGVTGWRIPELDGRIVIFDITEPCCTGVTPEIDWDSSLSEGDQLGGLQGAINQSIATTSGTEYAISFSLARSPLTDATPSISVRANDLMTNDQLLRSQLPVPPVSTLTEPSWQTYEGSFTAIGDSTLITLFATSSDQNFTPVYFDNVSVTVVPEPSGLAVLTIAFGAFIRCFRQRIRPASATAFATAGGSTLR